MATFRKGDKVKVAIEGTVENIYEDGDLTVRYGDTGWYEAIVPPSKAEKIEPPVTVFKPGDRLRRKDLGGYEITLGDEGYLQHLSSGVRYSTYNASPKEFFNSRNFEKVL